MDVELLSKMIGELVVENDQVGLPGVGTFVAELAPANFSDKGFTINPPYRRLSFVQEELEKDLLVDFYAASNNIRKDAAKAYMIQFLAELKTILLDRKTVALPGLGRLRATRDNHLFFVADENLDIFPDGFGLAPISLKSHSQSLELPNITVEIGPLVSDITAAAAAAAEPAPEQPAEPTLAEPEQPAEPTPAEPEQPAEPAPVAEPEPAVEPEAPEPAAEPTPAEPAPAAPAATEPRRLPKWAVALIAALALIVLAIAAFALLARIAPDFTDSILYTEEELRIINY